MVARNWLRTTLQFCACGQSADIRGRSLVSVAFAICQSNLRNSCSSLAECKILRHDERSHVCRRKLSRCDFDPFSFNLFCSCWARQQCHFSHFFILSEQVFTFMVAFGIAWFNNSTLFEWSWTRDQRIRSLFRIAKLYKTWSTVTACCSAIYFNLFIGIPPFVEFSLSVTVWREYLYPKFKPKQVTKHCQILILMELCWLFVKEHCFVRRKQMQLLHMSLSIARNRTTLQSPCEK